MSSHEITKVSTVPVARREIAFATERWCFSTKFPGLVIAPATLPARPAVYGGGSLAKRTPMRLEAVRSEPDEVPATPAGPEPTTTIYARVPWSLGEQVRDLARQRSKTTGRRVIVNDLVVEALRKLSSKQA